MRYYSKSTGSTYLSGVHNTWPDDAVEISEALYLAVIANPAEGKVRSHDKNGLPILVDPAPPSVDELALDERAWRDAEVSRVSWLRDRHRDQTDAGLETTLTAEQFGEILAYIQALRDWPQSREFPDSSARPKPPDWVAGQVQ